MNWLLDSDVLIEGERGNPRFQAWLEAVPDDVFFVPECVVGEFLIGVHAVRKPDRRRRGEKFYKELLSRLPVMPNAPGDFILAAELDGEAMRES
jgi:predicted nucleic acid-binding protein